MNTLHLFAGFGGGLFADLILGHNPICAVENDPWACNALRLRKKEGWFPNLNIKETSVEDFTESVCKGVDIVSAGLPCPIYSTARRGKGENLYSGWKRTVQIVGNIKPKYAFFESTPSMQKDDLAIQRELLKHGYQYQAVIFDASRLGAPHFRRRYWGLAYSNGNSKPNRTIDAETRMLPEVQTCAWNSNPNELRMVDGISDKRKRLKGIGNAQIPIVAACAFSYLQSITKTEQT